MRLYLTCMWHACKANLIKKILGFRDRHWNPERSEHFKGRHRITEARNPMLVD